MDFLEGKKTYITAGLFLILALIPVLFDVVIPGYVFGILGALGLGTLRAGISAISGNKGWKTYAAAVLVAAIAVLQTQGIDISFDTVYAIAGALGIVGIRDAVKKIT